MSLLIFPVVCVCVCMCVRGFSGRVFVSAPPASPAKFNFYFSQEPWRAPLHIASSPCKEVFLTRTGSRANQPNKCVSVVVVPRGYEPMNQQSYRVGYTALNTDQYQQDYPRDYGKIPSAIKVCTAPFSFVFIGCFVNTFIFVCVF